MSQALERFFIIFNCIDILLISYGCLMLFGLSRGYLAHLRWKRLYAMVAAAGVLVGIAGLAIKWTS